MQEVQERWVWSHGWEDPQAGQIPWGRKWWPMPVFVPGNPTDRGAWLVIVHGAAQIRTWLKQLSMNGHFPEFWGFLFFRELLFLFVIWGFFFPKQEEVHPNAMLLLVSLHSFECSAVVQSLSHVWLFVTPWTAARQSSLYFTISWSLLKLMYIESVIPSNHCCPLIYLPSIFPSIGVFSNESALLIVGHYYCSCPNTFSIYIFSSESTF